MDRNIRLDNVWLDSENSLTPLLNKCNNLIEHYTHVCFTLNNNYRMLKYYQFEYSMNKRKLHRIDIGWSHRTFK